jgi:DNA-binding response OmpR family regulator
MYSPLSDVQTHERVKPGVLGHRRSGNLTILIVEDHDDSREMLRVLFQMWGFRVVEACNGLEAVETAARERPALILMDGSLPFLDGLGATRLIREKALLDEVKIVALNGWGSPSYDSAALAAGCDDCLVKPLDFEQLWKCVNALDTSPDSFIPTTIHDSRDRRIGCSGSGLESGHNPMRLETSAAVLIEKFGLRC